MKITKYDPSMKRQYRIVERRFGDNSTKYEVQVLKFFSPLWLFTVFGWFTCHNDYYDTRYDSTFDTIEEAKRAVNLHLSEEEVSVKEVRKFGNDGGAL